MTYNRAKPQAVVEVKLLDILRADTPAIMVGEQLIEPLGLVPIPFEIRYDPSIIVEIAICFPRDRIIPKNHHG